MGRPFKRRRIVRRRKRSWRRKYTRGKRGFAKAVKNVILRTAEKKFRSVDNACNSAYDFVAKGYPLNHNSVVYSHLVDNVDPNTVNQPIPLQGVDDGSRNGDEIYAKGFVIRGSIDFPFDRTNTIVKMYMVEWNSTSGSLVDHNLQHQVTGNVMLDPFQNERWKIKHIGTFRPRLGNYTPYSRNTTAATPGLLLEGGKAQSILFKKSIPFKRKLHFKSDDSVIITRGMKERFSIFFTTYDTQGTLTTDTCAYIRMNTTLYYGDP